VHFARFTAITTGKNHLLALTSAGRVFAHPVNKLANHYGQLGLRKFHISGPSLLGSTKTPLIEVELNPKSLVDPYANASRAPRTTPIPLISDNLTNIDDSDIRFCTKLFELPVLRGVEAAQIAAGSRTSFLRTKTGRVLAWGANDFGYMPSLWKQLAQ
jgi:alpha-tubulin suppressor-like RCC1 family protein